MLLEEPKIAGLADLYDVHQRKSPTEFLAAAHEFDRSFRYLSLPFCRHFTAFRCLSAVLLLHSAWRTPMAPQWPTAECYTHAESLVQLQAH